MVCVETLQCEYSWSVFRLRDMRDTCHVAGAGSEGSEGRMHTSLGRHSLLYRALLLPSPSGQAGSYLLDILRSWLKPLFVGRMKIRFRS